MGCFENAAIDLIEKGDVLGAVRATSQFKGSKVEQYLTLYRQSPAIDCTLRINWQERYTALKLCYETCITSGEVICDVPYGVQERPLDCTEQPCQKWVDLTGLIDDRPYGLAILNDCKYGFDAQDGTLRMTLLRSPAYAHHDPARYDAASPRPIIDQGWQTVRIRILPHTGIWQSADVVRQAWELNEPFLVHMESVHSGSLPGDTVFLTGSAENVVLSVLKVHYLISPRKPIPINQDR